MGAVDYAERAQRKARVATVLAAIAVVFAVVSVVLAFTTDDAHGAPPDRRNVYVLGDSLTVAATNEHQAVAHYRGYTSHVYARRGCSMHCWLGAVGGLSTVDADAVVLALGTNDAGYSQWHDPLGDWTAALDTLDDRCVVVVAWQRHSAADRALWARLAPELAARPWVRVYDWHTAASGAPWVLGPDGVHHSRKGEWAYAWALDAAAGLCG